MNIAFDLFSGLALGFEFPGDGIYLVLHLGILRVLFVSDELMEQM